MSCECCLLIAYLSCPTFFLRWLERDLCLHSLSEHDVPLPDEYDQINRDLRPFRAISPRDLQTRLESTAKLPDTYTIRVKSGSIRTSVTFGNEEEEIVGARMRVEGQVELLKDIAKDLPDFTAVYTVHDTALGTISWAHRMELEEHVQDGECKYKARELS